VGITAAIIPARAGSKGIPAKNLAPVCGHPLIALSIRQALTARGVDSVWVSSDGEDILSVAEKYGAKRIVRPAELSSDTATSESAWLHAVDAIEAQGHKIDWVVGMQATSPVREASDISAALALVASDGLDSLLTVVEIEDFFMWRRGESGAPESVNYDYKTRKRRQAIEKRYLENGSFYVFRPRLLRSASNRLGGHIGMHVMDKHKMFQIDNAGDIALCEAIMRGYGLDRAFDVPRPDGRS
jgi:CMP-N,N'-diacetyllegionaminic acid synthase